MYDLNRAVSQFYRAVTVMTHAKVLGVKTGS